MRFDNTDAFFWIWTLVPIALLALREKVLRKRAVQAFGIHWAWLTNSIRPHRRALSVCFQSVALLSFIFALARPQFGKGVESIKAQGIELMIAVDVSNSMSAEDVKPSRLSHARSEISRLIDLSPGDRVGIIAFAGSASLLSPLTADTSALKMYIDSLSTDSISTQGTDVRRALREAASAFQRGGLEANRETTKVTRVILIVSDGEDHEPGAIELAKKLQHEEGIRVFAVAVGTAAGGPIPLRDERGYLRGYRRDSSGKEIISQVHGDFLRELATAGGGSFRHLGFASDELKEIRSELNTLQKAEFDSQLSVQYEEKYQWLVGFGLLMLFIDLWISKRRVQSGPWRGRFDFSQAKSSSTSSAVVALAVVFIPFSAMAENMDAVINNFLGIQAMKKNDAANARRHFSDALSESTDSAVLNYNLGTQFLQAGELEKALQQFDQAAKQKDADRLMYEIQFNRGVAAAGMGKKDEAIAAYQKAIDARPSAREPRVNIELLTQNSQGKGEGEGSDKKDDSKSQSKDKKNESGKGDDSKDQKPDEGRDRTNKDPRGDNKENKEQNLTKEDVGKILEELKRQENQVREKFQKENAHEAPRGKDW